MSKVVDQAPEKEKQGIKEGPPIWVESLMTDEEIEQCRKKYNTYTDKFKMVSFDKHERWRYGMGRGLSSTEIKNVNTNLEKLREFVIAKKEKEKELVV